MKLYGLEAEGRYSYFRGSLIKITARRLFRSELEALAYEEEWKKKLTETDSFWGRFDPETIRVLDFNLEN